MRGHLGAREQEMAVLVALPQKRMMVRLQVPELLERCEMLAFEYEKFRPAPSLRSSVAYANVAIL